MSQIVPLRVGRRGYRKSASADEAGSRNNANGTKRSSGINNSLITEDQLDVALQISSALMYLHEKNIMFRDLKPQNIGFDGKEEEFISVLVSCVSVWSSFVLFSRISFSLFDLPSLSSSWGCEDI